MKFGAELEAEIYEMVQRNEEAGAPVMGYEIKAFLAAYPGHVRNIDQVLVRLVKRGVLLEERDVNNLAGYRSVA